MRPRGLSWRLLAVLWVAGSVAGCHSGWLPAPELPVEHLLVRDQLVIYSDEALPRQHRMFEELAALRQDLVAQLELPLSDEPIHVHLFDSADRFQRFLRLRYPGVPSRRAIFVETDTRLAVYAHWGEYVAEDLRHEVTHGYLHAVLPNIPLWIDEGLAECFEVPRGQRNVNLPHLAQLAERAAGGGWSPSLDRIEGLTNVRDMKQEDYAETWAWVHLLLQTTPERRQLLHHYLAALRRDGNASPPAAWIRRDLPEPELALVRHVVSLAAEHQRELASREPPRR